MMLSDKTKLALIKAAPNMTTLELIEAIETECRLAQPKREPLSYTVSVKCHRCGSSETYDLTIKGGA